MSENKDNSISAAAVIGGVVAIAGAAVIGKALLDKKETKDALKKAGDDIEGYVDNAKKHVEKTTQEVKGKIVEGLDTVEKKSKELKKAIKA